MADPALYKGGNRLTAVMEPQYMSWRLKLDKGFVPGPINGTYTTFSKALDAATAYYLKQGLKVSRVIE